MLAVRAFLSHFHARFLLPLPARIALGIIAGVLAIMLAGIIHRDLSPIGVLAVMVVAASSVYGLTTHSISVWLGFVFRGSHY